ncbi:DUF4214 domain-containing protein [Cryobacterium sp. Y57]|uniref:DUF4214 domain-containing protein n=1 Tax=Cryobacterium sp. Y57 TaxID=2048287 RepID=UPI0013047FBA|nr:DUF4214 domain-containing protein [Cryobacterium sp. Y57]
MIHRFLASIAALATSIVLMMGLGAVPASAATASDFNPGYIISDSLFFDSASMNQAQVQQFLNDHGKPCQAGYICLKDYAQATQTITADNPFNFAPSGARYCNGYVGSGWESAAAIITKTAESCGISPKALIVLLEKEQTLVSRNNPSQQNYRAATGNGCPDTSDCDDTVSGFFFQMYHGARAFQRYVKNSGDYTYKAFRTNTIANYPARPECGTQSVYIANQATAALYNYTPYVPNGAAMSNLYGIGDSCSSYGNRNFWRMYTDWFGSPISGLNTKDALSLVHSVYNDVLGRSPDAAGLETWRGYLIGQGWPVTQVANSILYSDEYLTSQIKLAYTTVLHREFDQGGLNDWLNRIKIGTANVDEVQMTFMKSLEYYEKAGSTPAGFTNVMYQDMLGRSAGPQELSYWADQAAQFGTARSVNGIWNSTESAARRIAVVYTQFLKRGTDDAGIRSWTPLVIANGNQAVRSAVLSSAEYLQNARNRYPQ